MINEDVFEIGEAVLVKEIKESECPFGKTELMDELVGEIVHITYVGTSMDTMAYRISEDKFGYTWSGNSFCHICQKDFGEINNEDCNIKALFEM